MHAGSAHAGPAQSRLHSQVPSTQFPFPEHPLGHVCSVHITPGMHSH